MDETFVSGGGLNRNRKGGVGDGKGKFLHKVYPAYHWRGPWAGVKNFSRQKEKKRGLAWTRIVLNDLGSGPRQIG